MDALTITLFVISGILGSISVIEIYACYTTRRWAAKMMACMPQMAADAVLTALGDPVNRKKIQDLLLDQGFLDAFVDSTVASIKQGIYGLLGVDKKANKKFDAQVGDAVVEEAGGGDLVGLIDLLPDTGKWAPVKAAVKADPMLIGRLFQVGAKFYSMFMGNKSQGGFNVQ